MVFDHTRCNGNGEGVSSFCGQSVRSFQGECLLLDQSTNQYRKSDCSTNGEDITSSMFGGLFFGVK